jgi:hypothetical protein
MYRISTAACSSWYYQGEGSACGLGETPTPGLRVCVSAVWTQKKGEGEEGEVEILPACRGEGSAPGPLPAACALPLPLLCCGRPCTGTDWLVCGRFFF